MNQKRTPLPKIVWLMIIGGGLTRGAFFMAFPFLAIHLKEQFGADITTIGWIIGIGPLMGAAVGFYGAYLSDILGRRSILIASLLTWGCVQIGFSFANSIFVFGILSALSGIMRSISEPIIQAIISDRTSGEAKERSYHYRYYAINLGAAIGPVIGGWLLIDHVTLGFFLAGLSLILFSFVFTYQTRINFHLSGKPEKAPGFWPVMGIMARDRVLNYYVAASVICAVAYAQIDTALPIILNSFFGKEGARIFGMTIAANGITIILFQLSLNKMTKHMNTVKTVAVSSVVFGLGFLGFAFSSNIWWAYIASMVVLALGEILVFSNGIVLMDRLAPSHLRAVYHSAANLFVIGLAFGPPAGAWVLKQSSSKILFSLAAGLLGVTALLYLRGNEVLTNQNSRET